MSLRARLRSLDIFNLILLLCTVASGVACAFGLVMHLATGATLSLEPERISRGLAFTACKLILYLAAFIGLAGAVRRQHPRVTRFWGKNPFFTGGILVLLLMLALFQVFKLTAFFSSPIAWHVETGILILGILSPVIILWGILHGEVNWLKKR
jgi:TRAP-type C4-dicarboxylate transport system permease small subunit